MGDADTQPKVDNPYLASLKALRQSLVSETEELRKQLETTAKDMSGKKVWVGKTADAWTSDITGRRARVKTLVDKLIPAVDAEISKCPAKVTQGEAKMMRMDLQGY
jgi:Ni,Fe-hydrogenase III small subunit